MDEQLAKLEAKVMETIETIQGLRRENGELEARCSDLEARSSDLENQLCLAQESASQADLSAENHRLVKEKVGSLLSKLEAMG